MRHLRHAHYHHAEPRGHAKKHCKDQHFGIIQKQVLKSNSGFEDDSKRTEATASHPISNLEAFSHEIRDPELPSKCSWQKPGTFGGDVVAGLELLLLLASSTLTQ